MTLVRWRPFGDLMNIQDEINRAFGDVRRRSPVSPTAGTWYPAIDLAENENEFRLVVELPGMSREDVKISLTDNVLTLRGEKKAQHEESNESWHHVERTYGAFERSFHLSTSVNAPGVKARFENGLLTITLPKSEESRSREISIDG